MTGDAEAAEAKLDEDEYERDRQWQERESEAKRVFKPLKYTKTGPSSVVIHSRSAGSE